MIAVMMPDHGQMCGLLTAADLYESDDAVANWPKLSPGFDGVVLPQRQERRDDTR